MRTARNANGSVTESFRLDLKVYGMKDTKTAQEVYDSLGQLEGVQQIRLNIAQRRVAIIHSGAVALVEQISQVLRNLGLRVIRKG